MEKLGKYILDYCSREQLVRWSRGTNKDSEIKWSVTSWSPYAGWTGRKEAQQSSWYTTRRTVSTVHRVLENTTCKGLKTAIRFHMWVGWNSFLELTTMAVDFTVFPTGQWVSWGQGLSVISVLCGPIPILAENWSRRPFSSSSVLLISPSYHAILWPYFWTVFQEAPFFFSLKKFIFNWRIIAL